MMMLGPQTGQIHGVGSVYYGEMQAELILNIIRNALEGNHKEFQLNQKTFDDYIQEYNIQLKEEKYVY